MKEFIDATNYNLGIRGNLTKVCAIGISLAKKYGKYEELVSYLQQLPPSSAFKNPSPGLDELITKLNNDIIIENNIETKVR